MKMHKKPAPALKAVCCGQCKTLIQVDVPLFAPDLFSVPCPRCGRRGLYTPKHLRPLVADGNALPPPPASAPRRYGSAAR